MEKIKLLEGALVVLPLQRTELDINPQPNFLVIENIFGLESVPFPDKTGENVPTMCMNSLMKLQYREIVEGSIHIITFREFNQYISLPLVNLLQSKETLIQYNTIVNTFLPMIKFKGFLENFKCRLDVGKLEEYLHIIKEEKLRIEEEAEAERKRLEELEGLNPINIIEEETLNNN